MKSTFIVAVDGPAASGKSTLGRALAAEFSLGYVESGSFYRFLTYWLLKRHIPLHDLAAIRKALRGWSFSYQTGCHYDGEEKVTGSALRAPEIEDNVSLISRIPEVREKVNRFLRSFAKDKKLVVEGRDIGTAVFPGADVKIYLLASFAEREKRRRGQAGYQESEEKLRSNIFMRDKLDSTREIAPLRPAADAILIDNSSLTLEETLMLISPLVRGKLHEL